MNRRGMWVGAAVVAGLLFGQSARADDAAPVQAKVEPSNGVPFKFRTGFYTEVQVGFFTVFGGGAAQKAVSNGQPYEALSLGYDIPLPSSWTKQISLFFTAAYSANAGSCRDYNPTQFPNSPTGCEDDEGGASDPSFITQYSPQNFAVVPMEVGARLGFKEFLPRMFPYAVLSAGYTLMSPVVYQGAPPGGVHIGIGGGVQYGTRLDGLSVGLEVMFRYVLSPTLPSLAIYPRIAYVF